MHKDDEFLIQAAPQQARLFGLPAPELFQVDKYVEEGEEITFGDLTCTVVTTPGHSPGGVCYLFENDIFAGDTLFYGGIGRTDLAGGDYDQLIQSIKSKLFEQPEQMKVYCGHGPTTTIGREKRYNPFIN